MSGAVMGMHPSRPHRQLDNALIAQRFVAMLAVGPVGLLLAEQVQAARSCFYISVNTKRLPSSN